MASPRIVIDGTQAYGTIVTTITPPGTNFTIEEFKVNRGKIEAKDQTNIGAPNRYRSTVDVFKWTGTLQLATAATTYPQHGSTFANAFDSNFGSETYALDPVDYEQSNQAGQIRKIPVSGWVVLNPTQLTTVT
jgi:hypothetical protein